MKWLAYGARGEESVFPLDGGLNLPKDSDPHGLRERLVFEVARGSFEQVDTCADYLVKYREMLHYDRYLAEGFPIATGLIQEACRHLVKGRMDITGAHWPLHSSGDTEAYLDVSQDRRNET